MSKNHVSSWVKHSLSSLKVLCKNCREDGMELNAESLCCHCIRPKRDLPNIIEFDNLQGASIEFLETSDQSCQALIMFGAYPPCTIRIEDIRLPEVKNLISQLRDIEFKMIFTNPR